MSNYQTRSNIVNLSFFKGVLSFPNIIRSIEVLNKDILIGEAQ